MRAAVDLHTRLMNAMDGCRHATDMTAATGRHRRPPRAVEPSAAYPPRRSRAAQCLEFATGSAAAVLGPAFEAVDDYPVRVRLPDEPLMLVDRIIAVAGEKGSLGGGRIVTEHDVVPGTWYLDGNRVPICIAVEAGQADLFLCAYLGIDLAVRGKRSYRLLDATVRFHGSLPRPGDTVRYEIAIEKFMRQGETYLFFFSFEGYIGSRHLITMKDGCAGFFTRQKRSKTRGASSLPKTTGNPEPGNRAGRVAAAGSHGSRSDRCIVPGMPSGKGILAGAFGPRFQGHLSAAKDCRLPGGRMTADRPHP